MMKKHLIVPLVVVALACTLVACNDSGNNLDHPASQGGTDNMVALMAGNYLDVGLTDAAGDAIRGDVLASGDIVAGQLDEQARLQVGSWEDGKYLTLTRDQFPSQQADAAGNLLDAEGQVLANLTDGLLIGGYVAEETIFTLSGEPLKAAVDNQGYAVVGFLRGDGTITDLDEQAVGAVDQAGNVTDAAGNRLGNMLTD